MKYFMFYLILKLESYSMLKSSKLSANNIKNHDSGSVNLSNIHNNNSNYQNNYNNYSVNS